MPLMTNVIVKCQILSISDIKQIWEDISQNKSEPCSFFLSWRWIGNWLNTLPELPKVFVFYSDTHETAPVGICLAGVNQFNGLGAQQSQLHLNQSGQRQYDQAWIEYNDIFSLDKFSGECRFAWVDYCFNELKFNSINISTSLCSADAWQQNTQVIIDEEQSQGFGKRLTEDFADYAVLLRSFSKNRRAQIKRAKRFIESEFGVITIEQHDFETAVDCLPHVARLHQQRWGGSEYGSGFSNPTFVQFHTQLLMTPADDSQAHILVFTAGEHCLGYLYNFVMDNKVYFYLSGIHYLSDDNKCKVGLVMHSLAMQFYAQQGCNDYDFLGGESDYKRSLSDYSYTFYSTLMCKSMLNYHVNRSLRKLRSLLTLSA